MVKHIVLWNLKQQIDDKHAAVELLKRELEALKSKINVIRRLEVGINFNPSPDAYDLGLVSEFDNRTDLDSYQNHPEHQRVVGILRRYRDRKIVVDYESHHPNHCNPPEIKHVVLLKFKDRAEGRPKLENIALLKGELESLPAKIREIVSFEVGPNVNPSAEAYDLGIVVALAHRQDLETYLRHPEHMKVVDIMNRVRDTRVFVDYEVE